MILIIKIEEKNLENAIVEYSGSSGFGENFKGKCGGFKCRL